VSTFSKEYHDPIQLINRYWPEADTGHIEYCADMKVSDGQYCRIEQCGHDGTMTFTVEMLQKCLLPLLNQSTYYARSVPSDWGKVIGIKYKIGKIRHAIVFGMVDLRIGRYPGQEERVRLPVISEYVYR